MATTPSPSERTLILAELAAAGDAKALRGALSSFRPPLKHGFATLPAAPLQAAAHNGHAECVAALLPFSNPRSFGGASRNALMLACVKGHAECVAALLPFCDPDAPDRDRRDGMGLTAAMLAARYGRAECLSLLIPTCDHRVKSKEGWTALMFAACFDEVECLRLLIPGSNAADRSGGGLTALSIAASSASADAVAALLPFCDPADADPAGRTALMLACDGDGHQRLDCVRHLLPASNLWAADSAGNTALHIAAASAPWPVVEILLQAYGCGPVLNPAIFEQAALAARSNDDEDMPARLAAYALAMSEKAALGEMARSATRAGPRARI